MMFSIYLQYYYITNNSVYQSGYSKYISNNITPDFRNETLLSMLSLFYPLLICVVLLPVYFMLRKHIEKNKSCHAIRITHLIV